MIKTSFLTLAASLLMPLVSLHAADVANLRCEYRENPLGIDSGKPRLSWKLETGSSFAKASTFAKATGDKTADKNLKLDRGIKQTAYQVLVASSEVLLKKDKGDLWDSGKVMSDQSVHVEYAGKPLGSRVQCHWKVRVWTSKLETRSSFAKATADKNLKLENPECSEWSQPAKWSTGLLTPGDWQAKWIIKPGVASKGLNGCSWIWSPRDGDFHQTPPGSAYFRAHLNVPAGSLVKRASVVMSADNAFVFFVNGKEALKGDDYKKPQTADITGLLKAGDNIVAVLATNVGDAPSPAGLIGRVTVELADGHLITLETGPAWKTHAVEQSGWQGDGFDDAGWVAVRVIATHGDPQAWGVLLGQSPPGPIPQNPWLRRTFEIKEGVTRAVMYINTASYYELHINGKKIGPYVLEPGITQVDKRFIVNAYDVTPFLVKGTNTIAVWMGLGWHQVRNGNTHGSPILRAQLSVVTPSGPIEIGTDASWRTKESCITQIGSWTWMNFGGERFDAREFNEDWNQTGFDDSQWVGAQEIPAPQVEHSWQACESARLSDPIKPTEIRPLQNGKWVVDFGRPLTGWMRLKMHNLKVGQEVQIQYADIDDNRNNERKLAYQLNTDGFQDFNQKDIFISAGKGAETFCSRFNFHSFRYAVISGLAREPSVSDAEAMMIEPDLASAGSFECSNDLFNRIHEITRYTFRTQNPCLALGTGEAREKSAYGDGGAHLSGYLYNFKVDANLKKWILDWSDSQRDDGWFHHTAPTFEDHGGGPAWGGQVSELVRRMLLYYGDRGIVEQMVDKLRKFVDYLETKTSNDVLRSFTPTSREEGMMFIGDWARPAATAGQGFNLDNKDEREFFNNSYRVLLWQQLQDFAKGIGRTEEVSRCEARLATIRPLVHKTFYQEEKGVYLYSSQSSLAMALYARIPPPELRPKIMAQLENEIVVVKKGHLDTGLLGTFIMLDLLIQENRNDLVSLIMGQTTYPGWGYLIKEMGLKTWPETWSGWGSHVILVTATPGSWFYEGLAGILPDLANPGFKHFTLRPGIVKSVDWVKCSYDSPYGKIVSNWKSEGQKLSMDVTIPANTTATVFVPAKEAASVTESGKTVAEVKGVKFLRMENGAAVYEIGSGTYQFQSSLTEAK
jgi:alpha-L-rhamnosidase